MVMSVNGYIARENGEEDFLSDYNWETFCELVKESGNFIIGRKTFEAVKKWNTGYGFEDLEGIEKVVVSKDSAFVTPSGYTIANSPTDAINKLEEKGFENILVTGGAMVNASFMQAGMIDFIKLNIEPYVLGKGIPLFSPDEFGYKLKLIETKKLDGDIIQNYYAVVK